MSFFAQQPLPVDAQTIAVWSRHYVEKIGIVRRNSLKIKVLTSNDSWKRNTAFNDACRPGYLSMARAPVPGEGVTNAITQQAQRIFSLLCIMSCIMCPILPPLRSRSQEFRIRWSNASFLILLRLLIIDLFHMQDGWRVRRRLTVSIRN